ncbi:VOC family protein [Amycolatopsis sp. lyj-112]|uniref:VOC family protein n=1 Tax=Amycolatopsis sp. lyj-112 TaxID=2789288 RepID=UPI00397E8E04
MTKKIIINLPTKDAEKAKNFYTALGYSMNPDFTEEDVTCVVISDEIQVMLLAEKIFSKYTQRDVADATKVTEAILALSVESPEEVDELVNKVVASGGSLVDQPDTHDMHSRSFADPDGHLWEIVWFDPAGFEE